MNVLALDTCFGAVSVAVGRGRDVTCVFELCTSGHAERLMPMVRRVMAEAGIAFADLDRIAVTLGPGGFTGLRVGLAAARGFAVATGKPLVGITSLALMALTGRRQMGTPEAPVLVAVDARKDACFVAPFLSPGHAPSQPPALMTWPDIVQSYGAFTAAVIGNGGPRLADEARGTAWTYALPDLQPDARDLAACARHLTPLDEARPLYLRAADAKPQAGKSLARA